MSRCVGVGFPCPRCRFLRLRDALAFPRWVAIELRIGMILIPFQSHVNPDSVARGHGAQTVGTRSRPRRDCAYRRPAVRIDSRWAKSRLSALRYGWPRSRREQMSTWCREAAGHRPSLPPGGEGWTIPVHRARLHSEPYARGGSARIHGRDRPVGSVRCQRRSPRRVRSSSTPRATSPPAHEAPASRDRHNRLRYETTPRPERERRENQRMLGGPSTITS